MGHADPRVVERVYGKLRAVDLTSRLTASLATGSHLDDDGGESGPPEPPLAEALFLIFRWNFRAQRRNRTADMGISNQVGKYGFAGEIGEN
jgi:hypothetical protein